MKEQNKDKRLYVRLNENEYKIVQAKFKASGEKTMSEFLRKILLNGYVVTLKDNKLENLVVETKKLLANLAGNVNQIAIVANRNGNVYKEDLEQLSKGVKELWQQQAFIQSILQKLGL